MPKSPLLHLYTLLICGYQLTVFAQPVTQYRYHKHVTLEDLPENASGVTYLPEPKSLLVVVDDPEQLIEFSLDGKLIRIIDAKGFKDLEAVTYLKGQRIAFAEEGKMRIYFQTLSPGLNKIFAEKTPFLQLTPHQPKDKANKGIEGLAYNASADTLYAAQEAEPKILYQVEHATDSKHRTITTWDRSVTKDLPVEDQSGLHFNAASKTLLMVSDESRILLELKTDGTQVGSISLQKGHSWLPKSIKKAEGITMDDEGRIYIVSEPNLLFVFTSDH